jgi:hypothetical protein
MYTILFNIVKHLRCYATNAKLSNIQRVVSMDKNPGLNNTTWARRGMFWDITPCGSSKNRRFGGTYRLHLQDNKTFECSEHTAKICLRRMDGTSTVVLIRYVELPTRRHIPEGDAVTRKRVLGVRSPVLSAPDISLRSLGSIPGRSNTLGSVVTNPAVAYRSIPTVTPQRSFMILPCLLYLGLASSLFHIHLPVEILARVCNCHCDEGCMEGEGWSLDT